MTYLLCRNRVTNFGTWMKVFESHVEAHRGAGLELEHLWQEVGLPGEVFFLFKVESIARARAFMDEPGSAAAGRQAGVIDGEYHFLESPLAAGDAQGARA